MVALKFSFLCIATLLLTPLCRCMKDVRDARAASPFGIEKFCADTTLLQANKKVLCIICKGWDPLCWSSTSSPTTSTGVQQHTTTSTKPSSTILTTKAAETEAPAE